MLRLQSRTKIARNHTSNSSISSQKIAHTAVKFHFLKPQLRIKSLSNIISLPSGLMLKIESWNLEISSLQLSKSNIDKTVLQNIVSQVLGTALLLAQQDRLTDHKSDKNWIEVQLKQVTLKHIKMLLCLVCHLSSSRIKYYSLRHHKVLWPRIIPLRIG